MDSLTDGTASLLRYDDRIGDSSTYTLCDRGAQYSHFEVHDNIVTLDKLNDVGKWLLKQECIWPLAKG